MADAHRSLSRPQRKGLLVAASSYVLTFVTGMIAVGGVEWPIRLTALAVMLAVLIGGGLLLRRKLGHSQRADVAEPFTGREWPLVAGWVGSLLLVNLLSGAWEGRMPLLVLGGVLIALLDVAVGWWWITRPADG